MNGLAVLDLILAAGAGVAVTAGFVTRSLAVRAACFSLVAVAGMFILVTSDASRGVPGAAVFGIGVGGAAGALRKLIKREGIR